MRHRAVGVADHPLERVVVEQVRRRDVVDEPVEDPAQHHGRGLLCAAHPGDLGAGDAAALGEEDLVGAPRDFERARVRVVHVGDGLAECLAGPGVDGARAAALCRAFAQHVTC